MERLSFGSDGDVKTDSSTHQPMHCSLRGPAELSPSAGFAQESQSLRPASRCSDQVSCCKNT